MVQHAAVGVSQGPAASSSAVAHALTELPGTAAPVHSSSHHMTAGSIRKRQGLIATPGMQTRMVCRQV